MAKEKLPHFTKNTALAVVAFLFRIPVTRRRIYTEDFLRSNQITAKEAHRRGILGEVHYMIHTDDHPLGKVVVQSFNDEKLKIEEGQETTPLDIDPEKAARFACRLLFARKNFMRDLQSLVPFLRVKNEGHVEQTKAAADGSYSKRVPGFRDIRIDADEATRKHMGA